MQIIRTVIGASLLLGGALAHAACELPQRPTIPNGASASEQEMVDAQGAVRSYVDSAQAYLDCLVAEDKAAGDKESKDAKQARLDKYNAAVASMQEVGDQFNAQVREFKANQ
ncbi:MAG: hypothetical protein RBS88_12020 [Spongiibacteraceae bacterium]|jgi:hypothetical protein|nr:hypothetical protein [Spongiibacteraceae bacterium]